jgi:hypothetical protein
LCDAHIALSFYFDNDFFVAENERQLALILGKKIKIRLRNQSWQTTVKPNLNSGDARAKERTR